VAAPVYDPFLEKFQVGVYRDPDKIPLNGGFPKDLMEPLIPDTTWIRSAAKVLDQTCSDIAEGRTESLLNGYFPDSTQKQSWLKHHFKRLAELELNILPADRPFHVGGKFLLAERLAIRVFLAYEAGHFSQAARLANRLVTESETIGLKPREVFVWDLRVRYLKSLTPKKSKGNGGIWPTIFELGSFDRGNAWAIWVAHQRKVGLPVIDTSSADDALGRFLGTLRKTWLSPKDLAGAGFSTDIYAALGAKVLPKDKLPAHFAIHPNPPTGLTLQGWWAGGQRRMKLGNASV